MHFESGRRFWELFISLAEMQLEGISLFNILIESMIICLILFLLFYIFYRFFNIKISIKKMVGRIFLFAYLCFMVNITLINRSPHSKEIIRLYLDFGNPFGGYLEQQSFCFALLNILLFIPFGALLALVQNEKLIRKERILIISESFIGTMLLESMQLITKRGYFEITDLITNCIGGCSGMYIVYFIQHKIHLIQSEY